MIGALTVASVLAATQAANQYVATFADNGIMGTVTVDKATLMIELDLSAEPELPTGFATCTDGGMSYHIHKLWADNTTTESLGVDECGPAFTGGHWDPWHACGSASGNAYCGDSADEFMCIPKGGDYYVPDYRTDAGDYYVNYMPFTAEVGDWSGKYGKLMLDNTSLTLSAEVSSAWEVMPDEIEGFSVVFHCNAGDRAFCAIFEESDTEATATVPSQASSTSATAIFSGSTLNGLPSVITIAADGSVSGFIAAQDVYTDEDTDGCTMFEWGVFEAGSTALEEGALGADCADAVGAFYDPTHQCPSWSGSEYCTDGKLCMDPDYMYECDLTTDRYTCAPGDFSGKFGSIDPTETFSISETGQATLTPLASDLEGKVMAVYCAEADQSDLTVFACAPINVYSTPSPTEDDSGAIRVSFGAAMVAVVAAMW